MNGDISGHVDNLTCWCGVFPPIFESSKLSPYSSCQAMWNTPRKQVAGTAGVAGESSWLYPVTLGGAKGRMIYFPVGTFQMKLFFHWTVILGQRGQVFLLLLPFQEPEVEHFDIFLGLFPMALHTRASSNCSVRRVCYLRRCRLSALPGGSHWLGRIEGGQRGAVKIFHRVKRGWIADGLGCLGANGGGMI